MQHHTVILAACEYVVKSAMNLCNKATNLIIVLLFVSMEKGNRGKERERKGKGFGTKF